MCGIAGIAERDGLRRDDDVLVRRMLGELAHRGPDDEHAITDERCAVGARRLSIIDLGTGRQPLLNEDGTIVLSQNGEIYNYVELRQQLADRGHRFATTGDTEAIALLYADHGPDFVHHLRGMFAIALWDRARGRLVLARDRVGKKPVYWRLVDGRLTWASEPKSLLVEPGVEPGLDRVALAQYLQFGYVPAPRTIFEGIHKLPAATILIWDGGEPVIQRYWDPTFAPKREQSFEEDREEALALVSESVRLRLRSDVPVGAFLSGGLDSSLVVGLMAAGSPNPVRTFAIGFEEQGFDELPYARTVAQRFGTQHVEDVVRLDARSMLPKLADTFDEPFADPAALPTLRLAELAGRELKVVLTGDGGDEAFAGYRRYRKLVATEAAARTLGPTADLASRAVTTGVRVFPRSSSLRRRASSWAQLTALPADRRYAAMVSLFGTTDRSELLRDSALARQDEVIAGVMRNEGDVLDRALHADFATNLPDKLLVKVDRATMAWSLEARAPLLDHKLIEFAARLPDDRRIGIAGSKKLLHAVASRLLPSDILDRPKHGFDLPLASWFRGEFAQDYRDLVLAGDAWTRDHLDTAVASRLLDEHLARTHDRGAELWTLLQLELWGRRWATRRATHSATVAA
jgi:asparagine synthase (glutamine-hydrolysing)